jgi:pantetheine-phosphate adenylyltransferase
MSTIAVFAGSFDPVTIGHVDIVERTLTLFDEVIVAIGENASKKYLFPIERRLDWLRKTFASPRITVSRYEGLTVEFCKSVGATHLVRGVRGTTDFAFEKTIAQLNQSLSGIETVLLVARPEHSHINSTIVREILVNHGDASAFLPAAVRDEIRL